MTAVKRSASEADLVLPEAKRANKSSRTITIWFASNAKEPYNILSNFASIPIELTRAEITPAMRVMCPDIDAWLSSHPTRLVPGSEALWQAISKAGDQHTFDELTGARALRGESEWDERVTTSDYWKKKGNIGIIAKMAVHPKRVRSLGYSLRSRDDKAWMAHEHRKLLVQVWQDILLLKYRHPIARETLLQTGDAYLIERERATQDWPFWGAYERDGQLRGNNFMGECMMRVRAALQA